jgi:hypothetical protein
MNREEPQNRLDEQRKALQAAAGCWKDEDHPELKDGGAAWVHRMRKADQLRDEERMAGILRSSYGDDPNPPEWVKEILSRHPPQEL